MNIDKVKKFAALTNAKRNHQKELDAISDELQVLQDEILAEMSHEGLSSLRVDVDDSRFTVYPLRQLWAKAHEGNYDKACRFLKRIGLGDLVERRFNTNRLSAVIREWDDQDVPMPRNIEKYIDVAEVFKLGVRRANGK